MTSTGPHKHVVPMFHVVRGGKNEFVPKEYLHAQLSVPASVWSTEPRGALYFDAGGARRAADREHGAGIEPA